LRRAELDGSPGPLILKGCCKAALLSLVDMHLLYVDESGSAGSPLHKFYVLAGVAVFERETHWIEQELDEIAARFDQHEPHAVELHASPMRTGKGRWRHVTKVERELALTDALQIGIRNRFPRARLFASVLEKANFSGEDVVQVAFEQLSSRFDHFLGRLHRSGNTQRGIAVFDKCSTEQRIQTLAREFKRSGHTYGVTRNYAEGPLFIDSEASRLIQLADLALTQSSAIMSSKIQNFMTSFLRALIPKEASFMAYTTDKELP
jgi:hypothetical protein